MTQHRHPPSILDRLLVGGIRPEIADLYRTIHNRNELERQLRDKHQPRKACQCDLCRPEDEPTPEPGQLGAFDDD